MKIQFNIKKIKLMRTGTLINLYTDKENVEMVDSSSLLRSAVNREDTSNQEILQISTWYNSNKDLGTV